MRENGPDPKTIEGMNQILEELNTDEEGVRRGSYANGGHGGICVQYWRMQEERYGMPKKYLDRQMEIKGIRVGEQIESGNGRALAGVEAGGNGFRELELEEVAVYEAAAD